MTANALVSVRGLHVRYADHRAPRAVNDVSFDIGRGETFALVGESGCGKTTTARALLRLMEPESGEIHFAGVDVRALQGELLRRHRRKMQIVFQDPFTSLNPRMLIGDAVGEGLLVHDIAPRAEIPDRVARLLQEVGLAPADARRYPHELSGGQRQRVAIARALAVEPEFLVLDEAVSALDVTTQAKILDLFERLRAERSLTCLFIAHNLAVVQRVASTVAVMYRGRIVELAPAKQLFASPKHPYTRALIAAVPVPDPTVRRARVLLPDEPVQRGEATGCSFFARCPHAAKDAACSAAVPPLGDAGDGHLVACIKEMA